MPNEFTVVGENKDDDAHLLVVGVDGNYYGYFPDREAIARVEVDESWVVYGSNEPSLNDEPIAGGESA